MRGGEGARDPQVASEEVHFDDAGTLVVENVRSGFVDARWFSILSMGIFKLADGASVPPAMIQRLKLDEWKAAQGALLVHPTA